MPFVRTRRRPSAGSGLPENPGRAPVSLIALLIGCMSAYLIVQYLPPGWLPICWLSSSRGDSTSGAGAPIRPGVMPAAADSAALQQKLPVFTAMGDFTGIFEESRGTSDKSDTEIHLPAVRLILPAIRLFQRRSDAWPELH